MTNSVYQQKQLPTNYSGVTINISNPTVNAGTQACTCPISEPNVQIIRQNPSGIYGTNQSVVPYYYNSSDCLRVENPYYTTPNPQNVPYSVQSSQEGAQMIQQGQQIPYTQYNQNQPTYNSGQHFVPQVQYPQYNQGQQTAQMTQPQQYIQAPHQGQSVYNQGQQFVPQTQPPQYIQAPQTQYVQPNQAQDLGQQSQQTKASQQVQTPQNVQPAQYYLNNYNYNGVNPNGLPLNQITHYSTAGNIEYKDDMSASQGIINDLNERDAKQKELEENGEKKKVVALTNEYIMSLENYLNNPNMDIRLMASKEILTRLDEDKNRCDDAALNALLNKMLQDPEKIIRIAAMSALSSGLATGNDYTMKLLNDIQQDPNADKEDVIEVSQILLKMSETTEERYVPAKIKNEEVVDNA